MLYATSSDRQDMSLPALDSVLVVEDDGLVQMLIEDLVREQGARRVHVCRTPQEALRVAEDERLDCAILDVSLWGGTSFAVADALARRGVPFMFCTGRRAIDIDPRHRNRPILGKPFTEREFYAALQRTLQP